MIGGIVTLTVGPLALLGALAARNAQENCDRELENQYPNHVLPTSEHYRLEQCNAYSAPLYILGIGGAVLSAASIPLLIYGAKAVPARPATARLQLTPWLNQSSGGLRLRLNL